jgi:hypothetical protein
MEYREKSNLDHQEDEIWLVKSIIMDISTGLNITSLVLTQDSLRG